MYGAHCAVIFAIAQLSCTVNVVTEKDGLTVHGVLFALSHAKVMMYAGPSTEGGMETHCLQVGPGGGESLPPLAGKINTRTLIVN